MPATNEDEETLLELLNTTPVVAGAPQDELGDGYRAADWLQVHGGTGTRAEVGAARRVRSVLQAVVRGDSLPSALSPFLRGVALVPSIEGQRLAWALDDGNNAFAARMILAWAAVLDELPGRLRPCGNRECRRFLIDRSNGNRARWCSMAVCGNRMKARRHYQRRQGGPGAPDTTS